MPLQRVVEKLAAQQLMAHIDMTQHMGEALLFTSPNQCLIGVYESYPRQSAMSCLSCTLTVTS